MKLIDNKKLVEKHEAEKNQNLHEESGRRLTMNNTVKKVKKKKSCC
jgi:hypothetical protein